MSSERGDGSLTRGQFLSNCTHRERVLKALNHEEPDRVPVDLGSHGASNILHAAYDNLKKYLGLAVDKGTSLVDSHSEVVRVDAEILERFDIDVQAVRVNDREVVNFASEELGHEQDRYLDEWGITWCRASGGHYIVVRPPFAECTDSNAVEKHKWPDPGDRKRVRGLGSAARRLQEATDRALIITVPARVLSFGQRLCGFQTWFEYLLLEKAFAQTLLEKGTEVQMGLCKQILDEVGDSVDVVMVADDLGLPHAPQISLRMYRDLIKPYHWQLFSFIKENTRAKLMLHSDGAIRPFIGDLIEIGVDVLNPIQVSAAEMDTRALKREYGEDLAFWGGIDTQHVLPFGTTEEVMIEVRRRIDDLAPGGGYVLASVHNIQREVPPENVVAMFDAALDYGRYR